MTPPPEAQAADASASESSRPVVLVVDDDEDLADTYALWLRDHYEVRTAYGGREAIEALDPEVDVVLLDRRMPEVPGDEVLEDIREADGDCQVSMLTAVEPDSDIVDLPFDEYLVKPVTKSDIVDAVNELLLRSSFEEGTQEYLALHSTEEALEDLDAGDLRDPEAVEELRDRVRTAREREAVEEEIEALERLTVVNSLLRSTNQVLVDATSRAEVEHRVCELLVDGPYRFACVGEYTRAFDEFTPRATSHGDLDDPGLIEADDGPIARAIVSEEVVVADDPDAEAIHGPIEGTGIGDVQSVLVVPLRYQDTVYGALLVYSTEASIPDQERAVLAEIGDAVANAINSIESKKLLFADTVIELELEVSDRSDVFVALSAELGCRVSMEGFAPASSDGVTCYLSVSKAAPDEAVEFLVEVDGVERCREVQDRGESALIEATVVEDSLVLTLLGASASIRSMFAEEGAGQVGIEVAPEVDVRTVMEAVQNEFPDTGLISKRETERSFQSTEGFQSSLDERLTERQQAVIEATYNAGYFEWPRESTAEEIAESLDLAPPTLHEHLREAQRKLIETYLDESE